MFDQIVSEVAGVVGCVTELERDGLPAVIAELGRMRAMLDALEAMSLDVFAGSLAWADEGAASPLAWVKSNVGVRAGTAKRMLRVGELARCHPEVAGSLGTGRITLDHAVLLAAVDIPATAEQFAHDVGLLVGWAEELPADDFATVCRQWLALADEEGAERKSRRRFERRRLHLSQMLDGNWKLDAVLDAGEGAALHEAISRQVHDRYRADDAAKQTDPTLVFDTTPAQARADALGEVVRRGVAASAGAPRPSVSLIIDERALDEGGDAVTHGGAFLPGPTVQRFLCDCDVHSVVVNSLGLPVNLGRTARLVNAAQRRAIIARDRHCVFPGCDRPPAACQVHHVEWWEHGGATDIGNPTGCKYDLCAGAAGSLMLWPPRFRRVLGVRAAAELGYVVACELLLALAWGTPWIYLFVLLTLPTSILPYMASAVGWGGLAFVGGGVGGVLINGLWLLTPLAQVALGRRALPKSREREPS